MKKVLGILCCLVFVTPSFGEDVGISGTYEGIRGGDFLQFKDRDNERIDLKVFTIPFKWKIKYDANNLSITEIRRDEDEGFYLNIVSYEYKDNVLEFKMQMQILNEIIQKGCKLEFNGNEAEGFCLWFEKRHEEKPNSVIHVTRIKLTKISDHKDSVGEIDINGEYAVLYMLEYVQRRDGTRVPASHFGSVDKELRFVWRIRYDGSNLLISEYSVNGEELLRPVIVKEYKYVEQRLQFTTRTTEGKKLHREKFDLKFGGDTAEGTRIWSLSEDNYEDAPIFVQKVKLTKVSKESHKQNKEKDPFSLE